MIIPVILCGGSGTRLWPLSRSKVPKQFLPLVDEHSMFQNTLLRLRGQGVSRPIVICNQEHRFMAAEQLRALEAEPLAIILEPDGRNTAPAIAVAAMQALTTDPDPALLILPADHHIEDQPGFEQAVKHGDALAARDYLVTFGIVPQHPETGYGYIRKGQPLQTTDLDQAGDCFRIDSFVEKPDLEKAREYLQSGDYFWNSGMFMFKAGAYKQELQTHAPEIAGACQAAFDLAVEDLDFLRLDRSEFLKCTGESVDYALMEKTDKGVVVSLDAGWTDLGSWNSLWEIKDKDQDGNVTQGDVIHHDVQGSLLQASNRLLAVVGVRDHIVVETPDAVMVAPKNRVQDVKRLVDSLKKDGREEASTHKKVYRPWGTYETMDLEERFQVKRITVKPGAKLSLQKHHHRAEHWVVVKGTARIVNGSKEVLLSEDQSTYIPLGTEHRLENPGRIPLELVEVQTGSYLGEDDIVRMDDVYGRKE
ncbi:MAG: mannose-1-phosphate guanylyltransferase/mannose-6-phosphate isomerase [Desulfohalobiaceae bacterium]|nr:mannose-1-phosphate guanylyltransferase/mannose-6-phosphate isomerase [Desulfohalobiaceae bacterium]